MVWFVVVSVVILVEVCQKCEKECQVSARFAVLPGQLSNLPGPSSATEMPSILK